MCPLISDFQPIIFIAALTAVAVSISIGIFTAYNLILGWGDSETMRYARNLFLKALGWLALAVLINNAGNILCS